MIVHLPLSSGKDLPLSLDIFPACSLASWVLIALSYGLAGASPVCAQQPEGVDALPYTEMMGRLEGAVADHLDPVLSEPASAGLSALQEVYSSSPDGGSPQHPAMDVLRARKQQLASDYGLHFSGGYLENLEKGVFDAEGIYYRRRGQLELEWDILKNGLLDNRIEMNKLDNQLQLERVRARLETDEAFYDRLQSRLVYLFNQRKVDLLERRRAILEDLLDVKTRLYHADLLPWQEVLDLTSEKAQVALKLESYRGYNFQLASRGSDSVNVAALPVVGLDAEKMSSLAGQRISQDRLYDLQARNIELENRRWKDVSVSTFLRYNIYHSPANERPFREYFSTGISFSLPIPGGFTSEERLVEARKEQLQREIDERLADERTALFTMYYDYQSALAEYVEAYYRKRRLTFRLQSEMNERQLAVSDYSPVEVLSLLNQLSRVRIEIADIKQNLYLRLLRIQKALQGVDLMQVVEPIDPEAMSSSSADRLSLYVWSSSFEEYENTFILDLVVRHGIQKIYLSLGSGESLVSKAKNFVARAKTEGISVHLMAGNNHLVFPASRDRLKELTALADKLEVEGIHLDTEPHTFADWDEKKASYLSLYIGMLQSARELADEKQLRLGVSIPVFYDAATLRATYRLSDEVNLMAYGSRNVDRLMERTAEERSISSEKTRIALRTKDFESARNLRSLLAELASASSVSHFAVHDLEGLVQLK